MPPTMPPIQDIRKPMAVMAPPAMPGRRVLSSSAMLSNTSPSAET